MSAASAAALAFAFCHLSQLQLQLLNHGLALRKSGLHLQLGHLKLLSLGDAVNL